MYNSIIWLIILGWVQLGSQNALALKGTDLARNLLHCHLQFLKEPVFPQQDPSTRFPQGTFAASAWRKPIMVKTQASLHAIIYEEGTLVNDLNPLLTVTVAGYGTPKKKKKSPPTDQHMFSK